MTVEELEDVLSYYPPETVVVFRTRERDYKETEFWRRQGSTNIKPVLYFELRNIDAKA